MRWAAVMWLHRHLPITHCCLSAACWLQTNLQYAYAERLGDGRGVTYGFCGFTTGTSDGLEVRPHLHIAQLHLPTCQQGGSLTAPHSQTQVVEKYTQIKPNNPLAKYLPALRALEGKGDKFTGLNGFDDAIKKLGNDQGEDACSWGAGVRGIRLLLTCVWYNGADFIKAQWDVCDTEYHEPAMQICRDIHCNYALTKAQLHDALVNVGRLLYAVCVHLAQHVLVMPSWWQRRLNAWLAWC